MTYEERYGERVLTDEQEEELQRRLDLEERLEKLDKCVENIKDLLKTKGNLEDLVSEIEYEIKSLE